MTYGHDEYMYNVLVGNGCPIPEEGLYMIRFHSFYPWHTEQEYKWMEDEKDTKMLPWVLESTSLTCTPSPTTCPTLRLYARTTSLSLTSTALESSVGSRSRHQSKDLLYAEVLCPRRCPNLAWQVLTDVVMYVFSW